LVATVISLFRVSTVNLFACGCSNAVPRYLIRDRDRTYGSIVARRMRVMGIRDKPTAPASPWQNGFAERLIGSIRRECVDHFIVLGEAHLCHILRTYARYYNHIRTHWSLDKDTPVYPPFSGSDLSIRTRSWADFTITTFAFRSSVRRDIPEGASFAPRGNAG
jgi:hypothetical protein